MKRSGSSESSGDDRGPRLGPQARGSIDFLLLCLRRGVPPDRISSFLLGLGMDARAVNTWMDRLRREMAGVPERTPTGSEYRQERVPKREKSPESAREKSRRDPNLLSLEGKTATDFILPDLDATVTKVTEEEAFAEREESVNISLEISEKELQKAQDLPVPTPKVEPLFSPQAEVIPVMPDAVKVRLEKPQAPKERRRRKSKRERKFLKTTESRIAAFAACVLICWLLSDAGWFPGGSARHSTLPATEIATREEPILRAPPDAVVAPPPEAPAPPVAEVVENPNAPDPWVAPKEPPNRAPGSSRAGYHRSKTGKRKTPRTSRSQAFPQ